MFKTSLLFVTALAAKDTKVEKVEIANVTGANVADTFNVTDTDDVDTDSEDTVSERFLSKRRFRGPNRFHGLYGSLRRHFGLRHYNFGNGGFNFGNVVYRNERNFAEALSGYTVRSGLGCSFSPGSPYYASSIPSRPLMGLWQNYYRDCLVINRRQLRNNNLRREMKHLNKIQDKMTDAFLSGKGGKYNRLAQKEARVADRVDRKINRKMMQSFKRLVPYSSFTHPFHFGPRIPANLNIECGQLLATNANYDSCYSIFIGHYGDVTQTLVDSCGCHLTPVW